MPLASEMKILVVDDEPDVRNFLAACAEDAGFNVVTAVDGEDALVQVKAHNPDLMTLDMVMPKKSGYKVLKELRTMPEFTDLPVIVITAHANDEMGSEDVNKLYTTFSAGKGPKFTLEKPITPEKLINSIAEILDVDLSASASDAPTGDISALLYGADVETLKKVRQLLTQKNT